MKFFIKIALITGIIMVGLASKSSAQDRKSQTITSRAGTGQGGVVFRKIFQPYRVDDAGRPLVFWRQQVVYRAVNDTFVYRGEGKATAREENSSPEVIFHKKKGQPVKAGHVYSRRGN